MVGAQEARDVVQQVVDAPFCDRLRLGQVAVGEILALRHDAHQRGSCMAEVMEPHSVPLGRQAIVGHSSPSIPDLTGFAVVRVARVEERLTAPLRHLFALPERRTGLPLQRQGQTSFGDAPAVVFGRHFAG